MNRFPLPIGWQAPYAVRFTFASPLSWLGCLLVPICFLAGCNLGVQQHNIAGRQAFESGQVARAINEFQKAINLNPRNANAYYNLGATYYALGKKERNPQWIGQAEQLYRQAIRLDDRNTDAHRALAALLIETGKEKYAFDLLNEWRERYPTSPDPVVELARLYQEYGDNRRATDLLADALRLDGRNVRALKAMGHVREVQGQTSLALDNYLRALQIDSRQADVVARVQALQTRMAQGGGNLGNSAPIEQPRYGSVQPYQKR